MPRTLGNCPVVDLSANICSLNGQDVACNIIRECDALTGAQHFEYALPGGNSNANIWVVQPDGGQKWSGPSDPLVPQPTIPSGVQFYSAPVENPPVVTDPLPSRIPTPQVGPTPAISDEAPPPHGIWRFQEPSDVILPRLGPAPEVKTVSDRFLNIVPSVISDNLGANYLDELTKPLGTSGIPLWIILAAAAAGGLLLFGSKR